MRLTLLAALLLAPALVHAQGTELSAKLSGPAAPAAAPAVSNRTSAAAVRISTGVTPPQIVEQSEVHYTGNAYTVLASGSEVDVKLTVNEQGLPQNVSIVKATNKFVDTAVLAALQQYKFKPAMLDGQPVAMDMMIHVILER